MQNADTARQEFVANVSHELKTPMTTIAGYLDGMLDGTIPQPEQRHYMELVSTEVRRLSRLVRNMLEISRLKDQGIPADKLADFDICEAAGQALLSFEQRINRKHLNVDVDMPELGVTVRAMPDAVTQVLYNLIDNAVKFIDDGGTLSIRVGAAGIRPSPRSAIPARPLRRRNCRSSSTASIRRTRAARPTATASVSACTSSRPSCWHTERTSM